MQKILSFLILFCTCIIFASAQKTDTTIILNDVPVVSYYRTGLNTVNQINHSTLQFINKGQEPSLIFNGLPSVFATSDAGNGYGYSYFRIRGMDQTRINATLDGMPLNEGEDFGAYYTNYPDLLGSVQSVQVSNGSNITNNGSSAYAGSVSYESIDLLKNNPSTAFLGYGSDGTYKASAEYNSGLIGKWAFHIHGTSQGTDGYRDHAYNRSQSVFLKIGYFFNAKNSIDFLSFIGKAKNGQAYLGATYDEMKRYGKRYNPVSDEESDRFMQSISKLQYNGRFSDNVTLASSVYWNHLKGDYYATYAVYGDKDIRDVDLLHDMIGGNTAINATISKLDLTGGINGFWFTRRHKGKPKYLEAVALYIPTDGLWWNNRGYKTDVSSFLKANYHFTNQLSLSGAIQYRHAGFDYRSKDLNDEQYHIYKSFDNLNWNFINWNANVKYVINNGNSIYASVVKTHREPTRSDMLNGNEYWDGSNVNKKAEVVTDYELGYNFGFGSFTGNLNAFYMHFSNEYVLNGELGANSLTQMTNVDKSYRTGIEFSSIWDPFTFLRLENNTSWSCNRINGKTSDGIKEHFTQSMSPSWLIMQRIGWHNKRVIAGGEMLYRDKMYINLANTYHIPSSLKFNLFASFNITNNLSIDGRLNNILNKRNYSNGNDTGSGYGLIIESGRNYFADLTWKF